MVRRAWSSPSASLAGSPTRTTPYYITANGRESQSCPSMFRERASFPQWREGSQSQLSGAWQHATMRERAAGEAAHLAGFPADRGALPTCTASAGYGCRALLTYKYCCDQDINSTGWCRSTRCRAPAGALSRSLRSRVLVLGRGHGLPSSNAAFVERARPLLPALQRSAVASACRASLAEQRSADTPGPRGPRLGCAAAGNSRGGATMRCDFEGLQ